MGSTRCSAADYYQQLAAREKYTQGHGIPPYISEWDLHRCSARLLPAPCATREKIITQGHGIYVYQNGIYTVQRCDYYQQLVPQGEKYNN
jgi:hypothetical protein